MATINYPLTLPCPLSGSFENDATDPWVQDQAEVGAARRRKRFTRALGQWSFTLLLTKDEAETLRAFYDTTLDNGVEEFNWLHPVTNISYEVRFGSRPKIKWLYAKRYSADVVLEEI